MNDSGVEIHGIKIWGSPITPWFENWAFNRHRGDEIKAHWDLIPSDTEILITHGPCYGILDEVKISRQWTRHVGCEELEKNIHASQIKLHVFGHIHGARNVKTHAGKIFVNAASLNDSYKPYRPGFTRLFKQNERYVF
ncbi:metallophosphoesterase family protein [Parachlamydia acanthamoebae]|uniref:metallophosphoesterase family protein n=1 Tax=Parachlamydia acanthamoebae TaxID=83552 RepID=UPI000A67CB84|nr:hypothetical protein [Parachlamydia acanthamoebae]